MISNAYILHFIKRGFIFWNALFYLSLFIWFLWKAMSTYKGCYMFVKGWPPKTIFTHKGSVIIYSSSCCPKPSSCVNALRV